ncbi:response regulator transcription factor EmbR [Rhodococcus olei]|uniref:Response regulator transcription factor EmbR n=1 Tax=Rhodococcus olei TaxID=2161675 RepID=A0ABP8P3R9_9NOCA
MSEHNSTEPASRPPRTPAGHRLGFRILGSLEVTVDGAAQTLGGTQRRTALAMLLIRHGRTVSADTLADAVWDEYPPDGYQAALHVIVSKLRKVIGAAGVDPKAVLATASPGYRLTIPDEDYDLARFRALSLTGRELAVAGRFDEAGVTLQRALGEWRGPVLENVRGPRFVEDFADQIDEELLAAASARVHAEIECGHADSVIASLVALTTEHPFQEPLWAQLITALHLAGRSADALDAAARLRSLLADELGIVPSGPLRDLERRIRDQQSLDVGATSMTLTLLDREIGTAHGVLRDRDGRSTTIPPGGLRIGRKPGNDVVIDGANVSRHHAVVRNADSRFEIRDLGSLNGTRVNGDRIGDRTVLRPGDVIRIGDVEWTFEQSSELDPGSDGER